MFFPKSNITLAIGAALAGIVLTGCNVLEGDPSKDILGRWVSEQWSFRGKPAYVEFTSDGEVQWIGGTGFERAKWVFLPETGEVKISFGSRRCKVSVSGSTLTIEPPTCLSWDNFGPSTTLKKQ